ncbi:uncharacterized protein LOC132039182 [Lycium ferocissimum]|uniref:uncharacterized protein LOC132039182 n=1 Tax=Lycium ferocissimum TaxID=112874 RepID=UPI002814A4AE|nr:uncharacterized protein LOC132039182 [Lycium ferocissimum]
MIAKVLASRIQKIIASIISNTQAGFIPSKRASDNVYDKSGSPKSDDSVEWIYIEQVMEDLGFPARFFYWVRECVKIASRGLRQGDPMSPFLFAIAMEYLSRHLTDPSSKKEFKHHLKCSKLKIMMIYFFFSRGDPKAVGLLHDRFVLFTKTSGLQAKMAKSSAYFGGVDISIRTIILQQLGRAQLIKTLFGVQSYWAQIFMLPAKVLKTIKAYCRSYIWSGANMITKRALISWERMCLQLAAGGFKLTNPKIWNKTTIAKVYGNLEHKEDKLWIQWIHSYYIKGRQVNDIPIPQQASWMVRKIIESRGFVSQGHKGTKWYKKRKRAEYESTLRHRKCELRPHTKDREFPERLSKCSSMQRVYGIVNSVMLPHIPPQNN